MPESRIIQTQSLVPPAPVAKTLEISSKERAVEIRRLRLSAGEPFIYETSYFPEALFPGLHRIDCNVQSLYEYVRALYGIQVVRVEESVTAALPDAEAQQILGLAVGLPVIIVERVAFTFYQRPVEFRRSLGRTDRYGYRLRL